MQCRDPVEVKGRKETGSGRDTSTATGPVRLTPDQTSRHERSKFQALAKHTLSRKLV